MTKKILAQIPKQDLLHNTLEVSVRYMQPDTATEASCLQGPHRDEYYVFLFQQSGESHLMVDFEKSSLTGACIFCIRPGQVHYYLSSSNVTGWLVAANSIVISKALTTFFDEQTRIVPLSVDYLLAERLTHTVKALQASCKLVDRSFSKAIIFHLVSAYAGFITDAYRTADARYSGKTGRPFDITRSFLKMVRENHTELKRPAHYADKLAISTVYLNECVKFVTGMAVTHWVIQERILEAKRLLFHSQLSIKEIALRLGYADDAYFLESFRK